MLVTFGICFKQHFDTRYLVFYNPSPPRMFLSLDLLSEYRIQHGPNGPLQLGCRFDIMDNIFFLFWHMQLCISWYIRSFFSFTLLNILDFLDTLVPTSSIDVVFILSIIILQRRLLTKRFPKSWCFKMNKFLNKYTIQICQDMGETCICSYESLLKPHRWSHQWQFRLIIYSHQHFTEINTLQWVISRNETSLTSET